MLTNILIYKRSFTEPVDMDAIRDALQMAGVEFEDGDEDNMQDNINVYDVGGAVRVINALGYSTDEDDFESDYE